MNKGAFIAFEGTEGCGKSTQLRLAAKALQQEGRAVRVTMEPGGTPLGVQLREMLLAPTAPIPTPLTELFLYLADRAQHVEEMIRPALGKGEIVLTDRYSASTVAYQGYGRGLDLTSVEQADRWARGQLSPTLTLLLDCPVRTGLARARGHDRFHAEEEAFHERVRNGFLQLARGGGAAWKTIDATAPEERVHAEVLAAIQNHLDPRSRRAESG